MKGQPRGEVRMGSIEVIQCHLNAAPAQVAVPGSHVQYHTDIKLARRVWFNLARLDQTRLSSEVQGEEKEGGEELSRLLHLHQALIKRGCCVSRYIYI